MFSRFAFAMIWTSSSRVAGSVTMHWKETFPRSFLTVTFGASSSSESAFTTSGLMSSAVGGLLQVKGWTASSGCDVIERMRTDSGGMLVDGIVESVFVDHDMTMRSLIAALEDGMDILMQFVGSH